MSLKKILTLVVGSMLISLVLTLIFAPPMSGIMSFIGGGAWGLIVAMYGDRFLN